MRDTTPNDIYLRGGVTPSGVNCLILILAKTNKEIKIARNNLN